MLTESQIAEFERTLRSAKLIGNGVYISTAELDSILSAAGAEVVRRYLDRASGRVYQQKVRDSEVECFVVTLKPGAGEQRREAKE